MDQEWKDNVTYGTLPRDALYDGIVYVRQYARWFAPTSDERRPHMAKTAFKWIHNKIVKLHPARQLNYGSGHTYQSHYGVLYHNEIHRMELLPRDQNTLEEYERGLETAKENKHSWVDVKFDTPEECPVCMDSDSTKVCGGCCNWIGCDECIALVTQCPLCRAEF